MNIKIKNKRTLYLIVAGIVLIIAIAVCVGYFYFLIKRRIESPQQNERSMEEILKTLGTPTPGEEGREVPKEVLESLGGSGREER